ncbi:integral membrane protein DUF92-domain-containing protein [Kickxella alabastrina]|uniref:integral membrane protein DUF92-domain-containing protein n=1 Tax=Kickxella alabastrina TaxID=61397 RepID=UPI00221F32C5|nr:integral membrane protein DUF92-domain-containing protein [Kickxella alabastrina]KAI7829157.1 integral membrane protein DUF92-domain-containing protein [Kickxella alabastrina]
MRAYFAVVLTSIMCFSSLRKRSLSKSGALAAAFVGLATVSNDNVMFTAVLLAFFISSSYCTKYQAREKMKIDPSYAKASERDWKQVLCNGGVGSVISLVYQYYFDGRHPEDLTREQRQLMVLLTWAYIGFYSCCAADTWASELGTLSNDWPILITTFSPVPPGTNGGVSRLGVLSSFAGGAAVGLAADIALWVQYFGAYRSGVMPKIPYNMLASILGTVGSLIDSLLGATIQASYLVDKRAVSDLSASELKRLKGAQLIAGRNIISNNMVNVLSSVSTTVIAMLLLKLLI